MPNKIALHVNRKRTILTGIFALLLYGANAQALEEIIDTKTVTTVTKEEDLVQVADNVVILFDSSSSTGEVYKNSGMTKLQATKKLLQQRASAFPDAFPNLNIGLYSYTPEAQFMPNMKGYKTFYPMQVFKKEKFLKAVNELPEKASGATLLQNALGHLDKLLGTLSGHTVVILFTDGNYSKSSTMEKPVVLARELAKKHDVSFQLVSTTDMAHQAKILDAVASINASSRVYPLEFLLDRPEVYTGSIFVIEESYIVSAENRDEVVGFKLDNIQFDFDNFELSIDSTKELDAAGDLLKNNPDSYVVLAGFTDSRGSDEYNLGLSHRRVEAVGNYLANKFQIDKSRVLLFWYGEKSPIASNDTQEGRSKNRRVLGFISGVN